MPVLKWTPDGGQTVNELLVGGKGDDGAPGPPGVQGPPALYAQDEQPDWSVPPDPSVPALWLDTDDNPPDLDELYVAKSGDTMTGALILSDAAGSTAIRTRGNSGVPSDPAELRITDADDTAFRQLAVADPTGVYHAATKGYVDNTLGGPAGVELRYGKVTSPPISNSIYVFNVPNAPAGKQLQVFVMSLDGATVYALGTVVAGMEIGSQTGGNIVLRLANSAPLPEGTQVTFHYMAVFV